MDTSEIAFSGTVPDNYGYLLCNGLMFSAIAEAVTRPCGIAEQP